MTYTLDDLSELKSKIKKDTIVRSYCKIEDNEYIDEFGNAKTRTLISVQNKGNTHAIKTLLTYGVIMAASRTQRDEIASYFLNKFKSLTTQDKLKTNDKEVAIALISCGILTKTALKHYSNLQVTNLVKSYFNSQVLNKVIRAIPELLQASDGDDGTVPSKEDKAQVSASKEQAHKKLKEVQNKQPSQVNMEV